MNFAAARDAISRILASPLADLTESGHLSSFPEVRPREWHLPNDSELLWTHGLPPARDDGLLGVAAEFQTTIDPEEAIDTTRLFRLATFGTGRLAAAVDGSGVFCLPKYTEVHPQLRHLHPEGIKPSLANFTIAAFVDCAWRWHWLLPVLARVETQLGEEEIAWFTTNREAFARGEAQPTQVERERDTYLDLCRSLVAAFQERDSAITPGSLWAETILDNR
ncbi:hypothetical protein [Actinomadura sp. 6N118]|uniref:hypothetical protein n=1 Tax=Actinomadura sp. 6N118 TaxID=3375151 RepID=UPI0037AF677F